MATTAFDDRVSILVEVLQNEEPQWQEFIDYNNLGLPFAYGVKRKFFPAGEDVTRLINKTFDILLQVLDIEDGGYDTLQDLIDQQGK